MLADKEVETIKATSRAGEGATTMSPGFLMPPQPLTNFEIQRYQNERSNGAHSRSNLSNIKDGAYVIKHDEYKSVQALYVNGNNVAYFHSFGVK